MSRHKIKQEDTNLPSVFEIWWFTWQICVFLFKMSRHKIKQEDTNLPSESSNLKHLRWLKTQNKIKIFSNFTNHTVQYSIFTIINMKALLHHYTRSHNNIIESYHLRFRSWCFDCLVQVFIRWCGQLVNFVSKCLSVIGCEQYSSRPHWKQFARGTTYCTYNTQSQATLWFI